MEDDILVSTAGHNFDVYMIPRRPPVGEEEDEKDECLLDFSSSTSKCFGSLDGRPKGTIGNCALLQDSLVAAFSKPPDVVPRLLICDVRACKVWRFDMPTHWDSCVRSCAYFSHSQCLAAGSTAISLCRIVGDLSDVDARYDLELQTDTQLTGHEDIILDVKCDESYDPNRLLSASQDKTARVWDISRPDAGAIGILEHGDCVEGIDVSSDGDYFATCSFDRKVCLWDPRTFQEVGSIDLGNCLYGLFCPKLHDGNLIVTSVTHTDGFFSLCFCDIRNLGMLSLQCQTKTEETRFVGMIDLTPTLFATTSDAMNCCVWKYDGTLVHQWQMHGQGGELCYVRHDEDD